MKSNKQRKNQFLLNQSLLRKRRRKNRKLKERNFKRNQGTLRFKKDVVTKNKYSNKVENVRVDAGNKFSLFKFPEEVISLVNNLDSIKNSYGTLTYIQIDLSRVIEIDLGAISFLLAKVNEMTKIRRVRIYGNMPIDPFCRKVFEDSGFLDYMTDLSGDKFGKHSENFIIKVGSDRTRNEQVGKTIEKAMKHLTGREESFPPVYSIIQEICSNSVEWANSPNSKNKNWFLSVSFQTINEVPCINFTLTDVGFGILHTLNRKFGTFIKESLTNVDDTEILMRAFERKYGSKSGESNRNRGMPLIKDRFEKNFICDLKVITNNVFLSFNKLDKSGTISKNLPGTFYYWNVNQKCIETWNQIQQN